MYCACTSIQAGQRRGVLFGVWTRRISSFSVLSPFDSCACVEAYAVLGGQEQNLQSYFEVTPEPGRNQQHACSGHSRYAGESILVITLQAVS